MSSIQLWPKQQLALEFALSRDAVALLCEQRTGKTYVTISLLSHLIKEDPEPLCGVLICLLNNKESTWVDNLTKFVPDIELFTDLALFRKHKGHRLLLVHFEQLPRIIKKLCKYAKLNFVGIDEGHRIANRSSKQSSAAARLSWVRRRLLLTGTPIEQQPADLYAQFRFLQPDLFGTRWSDFESEYMDFKRIDIDKYRPGTMLWQQKVLQQRILKSRASFDMSKVDQFTKLIKPYCFRLTKEDVGIKPPKVIKVVVPLLGHQRRCYQEMDHHSVTRLPSGKSLMSDMEITTIMKRRQIASGFVYDEDGELEYIGGAKQRKLMALAKTLSKPVVVFTAFKPDTDRIYEALQKEGYDVARVYGKTKKKLRPDIWRAFQRAEYDFIVCQIRTGGVGVDLWKADNAIIHSMGHSYIDWDQAKARMDSKFKKDSANIYVLCAEDTVDEQLYELVLVKHLTGARVLNQLKKENQHVYQRSHQSRRRQGKKEADPARSPVVQVRHR
jgi:SNF2 family DNA or RNA helicase